MRNYWKLIEIVPERTQNRHVVGIYECGLCGNHYRLLTHTVDLDRTHSCKPCSMRRIKADYWLITEPSGNKKTVRNLQLYCKANKLSYSTMIKACIDGRTTKAGYKIEKLKQP